VFAQIIKDLNSELDRLRPHLKKCYDLKESPALKNTPEIKDRLEVKYAELSGAIDRASLCISILNYQVSLEISGDFMTVKFPKGGQYGKETEN